MTHYKTTRRRQMRDQQTSTTENNTACGSELNNSITLKANQGEKKMNKDIYQAITDRIIESLENGVAPWVKPWASCGAPRNAVTGREYSGINMILLAMSPFANPLWPVSYTHLRAHETRHDLVCRLLLEKKK